MTSDGDDPRLVVDGAPNQAWIPAWSPDGALDRLHAQPGRAAGRARTARGERGAGRRWPSAADGRAPRSGSSLPRADRRRGRRPRATDTLNLVWAPARDGGSSGPHVAFIAEGTGAATDIHVATFVTGAARARRRTSRSPPTRRTTGAPPSRRTAIEGRVHLGSLRQRRDLARLRSPMERSTQLTDDEAGDWVPASHRTARGSRSCPIGRGEAEIWSMAADGSDLAQPHQSPAALRRPVERARGRPTATGSPTAPASFQDPALSGWVREDFAAAQAILFGLALSLVALLLVALGAPLGSFTLALLIVGRDLRVPADAWRFLPGAACRRAARSMGSCAPSGRGCAPGSPRRHCPRWRTSRSG